MIHHGKQMSCKNKDQCLRYCELKTCKGFFVLKPFAREYQCKNFLKKIVKQ